MKVKIVAKRKKMVKFQLNQNAKKRNAHLCFDNPLKVYKKIGENEVSCHLQNGMKKKSGKVVSRMPSPDKTPLLLTAPHPRPLFTSSIFIKTY